MPGIENLAPLRTDTSSGSPAIAELLAHERLEPCQRLVDLCVDLRRAASRRSRCRRCRPAVEIVKPGRHRQAGVRHLREAGALAAEQCPSCPCCRPPCRRRRSRRTGSRLFLRAWKCPRCGRRARASVGAGRGGCARTLASSAITSTSSKKRSTGARSAGQRAQARLVGRRPRLAEPRHRLVQLALGVVPRTAPGSTPRRALACARMFLARLKATARCAKSSRASRAHAVQRLQRARRRRRDRRARRARASASDRLHLVGREAARGEHVGEAIEQEGPRVLRDSSAGRLSVRVAGRRPRRPARRGSGGFSAGSAARSRAARAPRPGRRGAGRRGRCCRWARRPRPK